MTGHVTRLLGCTDPKVCSIDLFISPKTSANNLSKFLENKVGMCFKKQNYLFWILIEVGMPSLKFKSLTDHWVEDISHPGVNDSRHVEQAIFIILTFAISNFVDLKVS